MIGKWKNGALDRGETIGTVFMDLSKAFDTPNHNLITFKSKCVWPFFQCDKICSK